MSVVRSLLAGLIIDHLSDCETWLFIAVFFIAVRAGGLFKTTGRIGTSVGLVIVHATVGKVVIGGVITSSLGMIGAEFICVVRTVSKVIVIWVRGAQYRVDGLALSLKAFLKNKAFVVIFYQPIHS